MRSYLACLCTVEPPCERVGTVRYCWYTWCCSRREPHQPACNCQGLMVMMPKPADGGLENTHNPAHQGYTDGEENLAAALKGADVVIIPAGVPRKPGMTRDDLFKVTEDDGIQYKPLDKPPSPLLLYSHRLMQALCVTSSLHAASTAPKHCSTSSPTQSTPLCPLLLKSSKSRVSMTPSACSASPPWMLCVPRHSTLKRLVCLCVMWMCP